jgi:DNA-binding GntR family transcriptional regulator
VVRDLKVADRRTNVDTVFDYLYAEIVSMRLLPGTKISEAEIAGIFDISRQPVRDAFSRLENLDLLLIRPQKATVVKRFSATAITTARFVRAAVEAKVIREAARHCGPDDANLLKARIEDQRIAVADNNYERFRSLDYEFHKTLCTVGDVDFAFDVIAHEKAKVDRLCVLGLARNERLDQLLDDHLSIVQYVSDNDEEAAVKAGMLHLSRLDSTITVIREEHADYFDD